jgi:cytochrome c oxidase subunit 2
VEGAIDTRSEYSDLFSVYVPIAVGVFALVLVVVLFALVRYRGAHRAPSQVVEANVLELGFAALLVGVAAALLHLTFSTEARTDRLPERPGLVVDVTASQWVWRFSYPSGATVVSTSQRNTDAPVPAGVPVLFRLRSLDVVHSFFVPERRIKKDVFPGHTTELAMLFRRPGRHVGECAEFCGLNHAQMRFAVRALPPAAFRAWSRGAGGRGSG